MTFRQVNTCTVDTAHNSSMGLVQEYDGWHWVSSSTGAGSGIKSHPASPSNTINNMHSNR
jgi:hypothetical protein